MLINWFTVGAQALNFLLLVWLLKHFLYKPILKAIDAREKRIATELADATAKKADAEKERDTLQQKNDEFDKARASLLAKASDDAKAEGKRLLDQARIAADALAAKRTEALSREANDLNQSVARATEQEVFAVARKALADLATTSLEDRLSEVFIRQVQGMERHARSHLAEVLKTAPEPALVRSAFDLPAEQRAAIQKALNETFSAAVRLRFEAAPDLISGIELTTGGLRIGWNIAGYLTALEKTVGVLVAERPQASKDEAKPEPKTEAKPEPKTEAKPGSKPNPNAATKPEVKPEAKTDQPPAAKAP